MSELVPIVYYGGLMALFFFWIYGIVSFALDLKHKLIPTVRQYRQHNQQRNHSQNHDNEPQEHEEQLY